MCGRYDNLIARDAYRKLFRPKRLPQSNFPPRYNIAPTDQIPIVRIYPRDGERELVMARWGLVPWFSKAMPKIPHINARAETVHEKALFREAFAKRRALIPATGFFEWQKRADDKQPYRFRREDLEPFAFAGLWEFARIGDQEILSAAIIVGEPNPLVAAVHDRMPVILEPEDYNRWLDADMPIDELRSMLRPLPAVAELGHCAPIKVKRFKVSKRIRRAVDRSYIDRFLANAPADIGALVLFMFQSGCRISAATRLEWKHVNLQEATVVIGRDKNGDPHIVHLTAEMVAILANLPKERRKVFGYASRHSVYGIIKSVCRRAGLSYLATHQPGRHSFATEMIVRNGIDVATTAKAGNWRSARVLLDNYAHGEDEGEVIERVFGTPRALTQRKLLRGKWK